VEKYKAQIYNLMQSEKQGSGPVTSYWVKSIPDYFNEIGAKLPSFFGISNTKEGFLKKIRNTNLFGATSAFMYRWASSKTGGPKILELNCAYGYGVSPLSNIKNFDYLGIDPNLDKIEYATQNFGASNIQFEKCLIEDFTWGTKYDAIIAFEVFEHMDEGYNLAVKAKKYCKNLISTAPYKICIQAPVYQHDLVEIFCLDTASYTVPKLFMCIDIELSDDWKEFMAQHLGINGFTTRDTNILGLI
jgi:hypothetical protein